MSDTDKDKDDPQPDCDPLQITVARQGRDIEWVKKQLDKMDRRLWWVLGSVVIGEILIIGLQLALNLRL